MDKRTWAGLKECDVCYRIINGRKNEDLRQYAKWWAIIPLTTVQQKCADQNRNSEALFLPFAWCRYFSSLYSFAYLSTLLICKLVSVRLYELFQFVNTTNGSSSKSAKNWLICHVNFLCQKSYKSFIHFKSIFW